jgi:hypothetical protein
VNYLICNTGANHNGTNTAQKRADDYSVLVTFDPAQITFGQTNLVFQTNRIISVVTNGGHFIINSLHEFGTNILMFGAGRYRASDIYLATTPASSFLSGSGTLYFTGLTNGQPDPGRFQWQQRPAT